MVSKNMKNVDSSLCQSLNNFFVLFTGLLNWGPQQSKNGETCHFNLESHFEPIRKISSTAEFVSKTLQDFVLVVFITAENMSHIHI